MHLVKQIIHTNTSKMMKAFKRQLIKFFKTAFPIILLIFLLSVVLLYNPNIITSIHKNISENKMYLTAIRWSVILILAMTWPVWIYKVANKYQWSEEKNVIGWLNGGKYLLS